MKIFLFLFLLLTDAEALAVIRQLWGPEGFAKSAGKNFQVGCVVDGKKLIVATSKESWEDAFSRVDLTMNGPRTITAIARNTAGVEAESAPVIVYACNKRATL